MNHNYFGRGKGASIDEGNGRVEGFCEFMYRNKCVDAIDQICASGANDSGWLARVPTAMSPKRPDIDH